MILNVNYNIVLNVHVVIVLHPKLVLLPSAQDSQTRRLEVGTFSAIKHHVVIQNNKEINAQSKL